MGFEPVVRPLLSIRDLNPALPDLSMFRALAFTSVNGVDAFARLSSQRALPVFTVGGVTAEAARRAGFRDVRSADGAIADLAALLNAAKIDGSVLAPGAREPAGDLPGMTGSTEVRPLAVYAASETGIQAPDDIDAVLLHSPRAARALAALWRTPQPSLVFALSEAVAEPVRAVAKIHIAAHPDEASLLQALGNSVPRV